MCMHLIRVFVCVCAAETELDFASPPPTPYVYEHVCAYNRECACVSMPVWVWVVDRHEPVHVYACASVSLPFTVWPLSQGTIGQPRVMRATISWFPPRPTPPTLATLDFWHRNNTDVRTKLSASFPHWVFQERQRESERERERGRDICAHVDVAVLTPGEMQTA